MYHIIKLSAMLCVLIQLALRPLSYAQDQNVFAIEALPLEVSADRTVSLSFPSAVKVVDRGSSELLAQKPKGIDNVVLIKAARKDIKATSLIVITADGEMHTFQVQYQQQPTAIGLQILPKNLKPAAAQISESIDQQLISEGIDSAMKKDPNLNRKAKQGHFSAVVHGLYISGPVIYVKLRLLNQSTIDYDIETIRLFTADKKQIKRSASQQDELQIIGSSKKTEQIRATDELTMVLAIPKLTLPRSKRLMINISEKNGARNLSIRLTTRQLSHIHTL